MLPDYLHYISNTLLSDRKNVSPHNFDGRRFIIGDESRTTFSGDFSLLQRMAKLEDTNTVRPKDWREKAQQFQAMIRGLRAKNKYRKGDIPRYDVFWQTTRNGQESPYTVLERLGVLAFVEGLDGSEIFFRLEWNGVFETKKPISYGLADELMDYFTRPDVIQVHDIHAQASKAERLIQEWIFFSRWLALFGRRERQLR